METGVSRLARGFVYRPRIVKIALLSAVIAATLAVPSSAVAVAGGCSKAAAVRAVLASSLPQRWKDGARRRYGPYEGLAELICHDFTRDGRTDMAVTYASGGTAGDIAWFVFRRDGARWRLALARLQVYKVGLTVRGSDLIETQPVYRKDDANCCPTGGYDRRRWHWNGRAFVIARRWHTRRY